MKRVKEEWRKEGQERGMEERKGESPRSRGGGAMQRAPGCEGSWPSGWKQWQSLKGRVKQPQDWHHIGECGEPAGTGQERSEGQIPVRGTTDVGHKPELWAEVSEEEQRGEVCVRGQWRGRSRGREAARERGALHCREGQGLFLTNNKDWVQESRTSRQLYQDMYQSLILNPVLYQDSN